MWHKGGGENTCLQTHYQPDGANVNRGHADGNANAPTADKEWMGFPPSPRPSPRGRGGWSWWRQESSLAETVQRMDSCFRRNGRGGTGGVLVYRLIISPTAPMLIAVMPTAMPMPHRSILFSNSVILVSKVGLGGFICQVGFGGFICQVGLQSGYGGFQSGYDGF